jgi:uncharacterized membrane protein
MSFMACCPTRPLPDRALRTAAVPSFRKVAFVAVSLAYPLLMYAAMGRFEPRWLSLLLFALAVLRALGSREAVWMWAAAGTGLLAVVALLGNQALPLKLYPALVNAVLLAVFLASLRWPPSMAERFARMQEPQLPPFAIVYTRRVTQVWCGFFVINGGLALATALWASDAAWALYNGLLAYLLMGVLHAVEWTVRRRVKAAHGHG